MRRHLLNPSTRLAFGALLAGLVFAVLAIFVPTNILLPVMNSICLGVVGAVTIVFAPLIARLFRDKEFDRVSQLIAGMLLMWLSLLGSRFTSLYVSITGNVDIVNSPVIAFLAYLAIIGGVLHISAPGIVDKEWKYNRKTLRGAIAVGVIIAVIAIYAQTTLRNG